MQYLCDNANAREAFLDLYPKGLHLSFSEMICQVKKHEALLLGLCKDFAQEIAFLTQKAEQMAEHKFRADILEQMPKR
eukprot:829952-Alexandrium_andersonii.AAC.1